MVFCRFAAAGAALALWWSSAVVADELGDAVAGLERAWVKGFYQTPARQQEGYFAELEDRAHQVTSRFAGRAEPLIWEGVIAGTHASFQSFWFAGSTARKARDLLLAAEKIDPSALDGFALASLGRLYYKVPSGISFGNHTKARAYLERALKIDPNGITQNFFYGEFCAEEGDKAGAVEHLKRAVAAAPRRGHEAADAGCLADARKLLHKLTN